MQAMHTVYDQPSRVTTDEEIIENARAMLYDLASGVVTPEVYAAMADVVALAERLHEMIESEIDAEFRP